MWMVVSNIVIGLYIPDMLSYSDRTVLTGHVVSVVCYVCGWYVQI